MKTILIGVLFLFILPFYAQTELRKQSVDSGGALAQSSSITMVFTVGEVVVAEGNASTYQISEGFIGQDILIYLGIHDYSSLFGISIYPNPVKDRLFFKLPDNGSYSVQFFSLEGKTLTDKIVLQDLTNGLEIQNFGVSTFLVVIKDESNQCTKVFTLINQ